jgi:hypothetical protein
LRIVDHAQQRTLVSHLRKQAQGRQTDEKAVRHGSVTQGKCRLERMALRAGKTLEPIEQGRAQLMQRRKGELHLGLHARGPQHPEIRRRPDYVVEQRRLPNARLAPHEQHAALPGPRPLEQSVEHRTLVSSALQYHPSSMTASHGTAIVDPNPSSGNDRATAPITSHGDGHQPIWSCGRPATVKATRYQACPSAKPTPATIAPPSVT